MLVPLLQDLTPGDTLSLARPAPESMLEEPFQAPLKLTPSVYFCTLITLSTCLVYF